MVLGRSSEMMDRIRILALHGMSKDAWKRFGDEGFKHYDVVAAGFKYNMMDLQAALGIHQLRKVERNWRRRQAIWNRYQDAFAASPVGRPSEPEPDTTHAYHLYTLTIDEARAGMSRDHLMSRLGDAGIGTGVHYRSLAQHPYYRDTFGWDPGDYPVSTAFGNGTISLPLGPGLSDADVDRIVETLDAVLRL